VASAPACVPRRHADHPTGAAPADAIRVVLAGAEGRGAKQRFLALSELKQEALPAFLNTL